MKDTEIKSCIGTIEMLRRLHGVMNVIDADNCEKIIKVLSDIPKYKDAYNKGYEAGVKATNIDCGVVWEERIDAIKSEITDMAKEFEKQCDYGRYFGLNYALEIIDKHCGGDKE